MDYHLHYQGRNLGVFSLEELRRRRSSGEFSGAEQVWCSGMPNWAPLDSVLQPDAQAPRPLSAPPPLPGAQTRKSRQTLIATAVFVASAILVGFAAFKFIRQATYVARAVKSVGSAAGVAEASRPVVTSTNGVTERSLNPRHKAFRVRQYLENYRAHSRHDAPWNPEAERFLQTWINETYDGPAGTPSAQAQADKLAGPGACDDPVVLMAAAVTAIEMHERTRRLERALDSFQNSSHTAYPKFCAAVSLADMLGTQSPRLRELDQTALKYFTQAFTDGSFQPEDEEEIADVLIVCSDYDWLERNSTAVAGIVKQAKGFDWLASLLEGKDQVTLGWAARGGGYANTVTGAARQGFSEHLAKARTAYARAWKLHPERAQAAAAMVQVAMGDSEAEEMRLWFDRATQAQIDSPQAWNQFRWGLRPRWHGSLEAMRALGVQAVNTRRFDTDVPRKFFDVLDDMEQELEREPGQHIYGRADIWPVLQQMYEGYVAEPSQAKYRHGWRSSYCRVAFLAGKYETARKQLEALDWQLAPDDATDWGRDLSLMPLQVAALTGKSADRISRAESSYERHDLAHAAKVYSELAGSAEIDERTRRFCQSRLAALRQEELLAKGEWISLLPAKENDPNWALDGNKVRCLADGAVEVEAGPRGHSLYARTRVGAAFEITGEFEVVRSSTQDFQAGVTMGLPGTATSEWYGFRLKRNAAEGQVACFSIAWTSQQASWPVTLDARRNSFRFRLQNGKAEIWVNGNLIAQRVTLSKNLGLNQDSFLGIGAYNDTNETVIRYRDVKARRLTGQSAPS